MKNTPSSIEETALAVNALLDSASLSDSSKFHEAVRNGTEFLLGEIQKDGLHNPNPIGFYFASLWYFEKLYPAIYSVAALGRVREYYPLLAR